MTSACHKTGHETTVPCPTALICACGMFHKLSRAVSTVSRLLLELLELLFDKFNAVAAAHSVVLGHLQQTVASPCSQHDGEIKLYDMVDVWVKIQDVLQVRIPQVGTSWNSL